MGQHYSRDSMAWVPMCEKCKFEYDYRGTCPCDDTSYPPGKTGDQITLELNEDRIRRIIRQEIERVLSTK